MNNKIGTISTLVIFFALISCPLRGALVAGWQFNSYTGTASTTADFGSQAGTASLTVAIGNGTKDTLGVGTGATLNQIAASSPNNSLNVVHGSSGNNSKQDTLTLQFSGTGLAGFILTYASVDTAGALNTWAYSVNGTTFTAVTPTITPTTSYATYTIDFSGIAALNNATTVYLQDSFNTSGSLDFDNIQINPVPEPIAYALPLFGLIFIGGTAGRHYLGRLRKS